MNEEQTQTPVSTFLDLMEQASRTRTDSTLTQKDIFLDGRYSSLPLTIRKVTYKELSKYKKLCRVPVPKSMSTDIDQDKLAMMIVVNHTANPDFRDSEVQARKGVNTPEGAVMEWFEPAEIESLLQAIFDFSNIGQGGYSDSSEKEFADSVKNS